jgi:hypothetical protein
VIWADTLSAEAEKFLCGESAVFLFVFCGLPGVLCVVVMLVVGFWGKL